MTETSHHKQESFELAIAMEQQTDQTSDLYQEDHFSEAKFFTAILSGLARVAAPLIAKVLPKVLSGITNLSGNAVSSVTNMIPSVVSNLGGTATQLIGNLVGSITGGIFTDDEKNIEQETTEITPQLSVENGSYTKALATTLSKLMGAAQSVDTDGNMAGAFFTKDAEEWSEAKAKIEEDPLDTISGALSVDSTMESLSSLSEIVSLYQLKDVIHAYKNAENFGSMLKRRPSYKQFEQIRRLADVHPEDLQDLIDEHREYQASNRGYSNRFLKPRVMIGELMSALRGDHPTRYRRSHRTSSDSERELMRLAFLEENKQESEAPRYHNHATKRRMAYERIPFKHIPQVQLKLLETKNVLLNGRPQLLYSLLHDIAFPIELKTPKPIGSAFLRLQIKSAISERIVLQKSYRLKNIKNGILPTIPKFTKEELRDVEPDQDYMLSVRLLWKNHRGEMYGTALVVPISLMKSFLFDSIKEGGEPIPFDLIKNIRSLWHKVWEYKLPDDTDGLDIDYTYYIAVEKERDKNAQMPTKSAVKNNFHGEPEKATLQSGMIISPYVLNHLLDKMGDYDLLHEEELAALTTDEALEALQYKAAETIQLYGNKGDTLAIWVFPELNICPVVLKSPEHINDHGMVTAVSDYIVQFPIPECIHFMGGK
tara:strand:- start:645 stop:2606 length:1962 start_codon:yes stop_codon:yes gene_type:complete